MPKTREMKAMPVDVPAQATIPPVFPVSIQNPSLTVTASPDKPLSIAWPSHLTWAKVFSATGVSTPRPPSSYVNIWTAPANAAYRVIVRDFRWLDTQPDVELKIGHASLMGPVDPKDPSTHREYVVCDGEKIDFRSFAFNTNYYIQVIRIAG